MGQTSDTAGILREEAARLRTTAPSPINWRTVDDGQPLLRAAELLVQAGDMDAAVALLQPTVYDPAAKTSPINRLGDMSEWRMVARILDMVVAHETAMTRPADVLAVRLVLGTAYERLFDYDRAQPQLDTALRLAREQANMRAEGFILSRMGNMVAERGDSVTSLRIFYEALAMARQAADGITESTVLCNIGFIYKEQGRISYAITFYQQAWKIAQRRKDVRAEAWYGLNIVAALLATGDYTAGLAFINQYLPRAVRLGGQDSAAYILVYKGNALTQLGRATAARTAYNESLALSQKVRLHAQQILAHVGLAELALIQGDVGRARAEVIRAESETALVMEGGTARPQVYLLVINVRAALLYAEGNRDKAAAYYKRMCGVAAESKVVSSEADARNGLARIARDRGDLDTALTELLLAYKVIGDSEHRSHALTVAALKDLAAVWPTAAQQIDASAALTDAQRTTLRREMGL